MNDSLSHTTLLRRGSTTTGESIYPRPVQRKPRRLLFVKASRGAEEQPFDGSKAPLLLLDCTSTSHLKTAVEELNDKEERRSPSLDPDIVREGSALRAATVGQRTNGNSSSSSLLSSPSPLHRALSARLHNSRISKRFLQAKAKFQSNPVVFAEHCSEESCFVEFEDDDGDDIFGKISISRSATMSTVKPTYPSSNGTYARGSPPRHPAGGPPHGHGQGGPGQAGGGAPPPDSYFTETKKGEVNELRNLLRNFAVEKDQKKQRDIIKKVIAYMTLGIDVSRLFSDMMLVIETRDLVIKKMVYLFLCNYATSNPELAQMCTNTFQKDCSNDDPMVRGLALRSLCSLNLPQMVEYISEPLTRALKDHHGYVRKTGVMGVLKMYRLDREAFDRCNFMDTLYDMLRDPDAQVVSNCIIVLEEIMAKSETGGMAINRAIMLHLLNRIHEFSEFGVIALLQLVPRYRPSGDDEMYQIMNLLDPVFRTNNAGAVMAIIRAFLSFADQSSNEDMQRQIVERIKAPMLTLCTGGSSELTYMLLRHIDVLVTTSPGVFDDEYRQFYIRYSEPSYNKYLKTTLLGKVASPYNSQDIVAELCVCACDVDKRLCRIALRSLARIACGNNGGEGCAEAIVNEMVNFLDMGIPHVSAEAAAALKDILRKHPPLGVVMAPPLPRALRFIDDPAGKASVIWLLGELADQIQEAPYSLEKVINKYDTIEDSTVKLSLLTSTMKVFFKRPAETQKMLGRLLKAATDDISSQDLHDRALLYHRLLKTDPKVAETVISSSKAELDSTDSNFAEDMKSKFHEELLREFNTLAIIYKQTSDSFIDENFLVKFVLMKEDNTAVGVNNDATNAPPTGGAAVAPPFTGVEDLTSQVQGVHIAPSVVPVEAPNNNGHSGHVVDATTTDLLGFDAPTNPTPAPVVSPQQLDLSSNVTMSGDKYQELWAATADSSATTKTFEIRSFPSGTAEVESTLTGAKIFTMASGELPTELKFFLYAQEDGPSSSIIYLLQMIMNKETLTTTVTIKSSGDTGGNEKMEQLIELLKAILIKYI